MIGAYEKRTLVAVVAALLFAAVFPAEAQVKADWRKWHEIELVYRANKNDEAMKKFREFVETYPTNDYVDNSLWYISEILYSRLHNYAETVKVCQELISKCPGSNIVDDAYLRIAECYYRQKKYKERIEVLLSMEDNCPNSDRLDYAFSRAVSTAYDLMRDYAQAAEIGMKSAEKLPNSGYTMECLMRAGYAYRILGRRDDAVKAFELAAKCADAYAQRYRAEALYSAASIYRDLKQYDRAETLFRQCAENSSVAYQADEALSMIGDMKMYTTRDNAGAAEAFEELLEKFPKSELADDAAYKLGDIYAYRLKQHDYEKAVKYSEIVFEGYPQSEYADNCLCRYADLQCNRLKNYDKAIEACKRLLEKYPGSEYADMAQKLLNRAQKAAGQ